MEIYDVLKLECCIEDFSAENKDEALQKLARLMKRSEVFKNHSEDQIHEALKNREEKGSTGFTSGIAIPHCQLKGLKEFAVGIAVSKKGIAFDSMDKKKSKIFVVIVGPDDHPDDHIKILAQVSRLLNKAELRDLMVKSASRVNIYESFLQNAHADMPDITAASKDKLALIIVKDEDKLEMLTEIFVEYGVTAATILESQNMENILSNVPLFLEFFDFSGEKKVFSKLIIAKINESRLPAVVRAMEDEVGDLDNYSGIAIMVLDLAYSKGNL